MSYAFQTSVDKSNQRFRRRDFARLAKGGASALALIVSFSAASYADQTADANDTGATKNAVVSHGQDQSHAKALLVAGAGIQSGQSGTQAASATGAVNEIQITGTRISHSGMATPTPVTVMQADELQRMAPANLIDALSEVPTFFNNDTPDTAASKADAAGAANVNLRGLGAKRTLVLLDGRRVVPSNRLGNVDINLFPQSLIQRVDVVTGGASAAYGSDAIAGVVNLILDTKFTGVKGTIQGGITDIGDDQNYDVSLAAGTPIGDKLHLIVSGEMFHSSRIDNLNGRKWYNGTGLVTNPAWTAGGCKVNVLCSAGPQYLIEPNVVSSVYTNGGVISAPGSAINNYYFLGDGSAVPFQYGNPVSLGGSQSMSGGSGYNPTNYDPNVHTQAYPHGTRSGSFIPENFRSNAFAHLTYDLSDNVQIYGEGIVGHTRTDSVGTLPLSFGGYALTVYQGNPFLPQWIENAMVNEGLQSFKLQRYNTAADIAQDRFIMTNITYSFTVGVNANITSGFLSGWNVNAYFQGGWNHNLVQYKNFNRTDRLAQALDVVTNPVTGAPACYAAVVNPTGPYADCVPLDLFGAGRASQEAINYVNGSIFVRDATKQQNGEISASGDIYDGWGAGAVSLAVGGSWRRQYITQVIGPSDMVDQTPLANDPANGIRGIPVAWLGTDDRLAFTSINNFSGSYDVKELFAETLVPLLANKPFIQQMNLNLAVRWADYEGSGGIWAWKAGLDWQTTSEIRLRGTWSRDIRAASLEERFDSQGQGTSINDPFNNGANVVPEQIRGGNPNVSPEKADTLTVGVVYQPSWLDGFSASLDWYHIKIKGAIDLLTPQQIVDQCFQTSNPNFCNRIVRDPASNLITLINNTYINITKQTVSGADLEVGYTTQARIFGGGAESLSTRVIASWLDHYVTIPFGATPQEYAGSIGNGYPRYRATGNLTYNNGPFTMFLQERFISGGKNTYNYTTGIQISDNHVAAAWYTDLRFSYNFKAVNDGDWQFFVNIANVLNQSPPVRAAWSSFSGTGYGNEYLYDVLGRRFTMGVKFNY
jgi:iron complex outermembrane receptor protein